MCSPWGCRRHDGVSRDTVSCPAVGLMNEIVQLVVAIAVAMATTSNDAWRATGRFHIESIAGQDTMDKRKDYSPPARDTVLAEPLKLSLQSRKKRSPGATKQIQIAPLRGITVMDGPRCIDGS